MSSYFSGQSFSHYPRNTVPPSSSFIDQSSRPASTRIGCHNFLYPSGTSHSQFHSCNLHFSFVSLMTHVTILFLSFHSSLSLPCSFSSLFLVGFLVLASCHCHQQYVVGFGEASLRAMDGRSRHVPGFSRPSADLSHWLLPTRQFSRTVFSPPTRSEEEKEQDGT